jgi:hypothetical protein
MSLGCSDEGFVNKPLMKITAGEDTGLSSFNYTPNQFLMEIPALYVDSRSAINSFMLATNGKSEECGLCYYSNKLRTYHLRQQSSSISSDILLGKRIKNISPLKRIPKIAV